MRLRTLLLLAFALLALLPLAVTVPFASRRIEVTFARELAGRADSAARLASAELDRLRADVDQSVSACATEWHAPSPFWNATAPNAEASSICSRAARSLPFCTADLSEAAMRRSPSMATASASGWSPLAT